MESLENPMNTQNFNEKEVVFPSDISPWEDAFEIIGTTVNLEKNAQTKRPPFSLTDSNVKIMKQTLENAVAIYRHEKKLNCGFLRKRKLEEKKSGDVSKNQLTILLTAYCIVHSVFPSQPDSANDEKKEDIQNAHHETIVATEIEKHSKHSRVTFALCNSFEKIINEIKSANYVAYMETLFWEVENDETINSGGTENFEFPFFMEEFSQHVEKFRDEDFSRSLNLLGIKFPKS